MPVVAGVSIESGYERPYLDTIDVTTPAAGAAASYTIPGQYWLRVVAARLNLTTDGNAANRFVSLDYVSGRGTTYARNAAAVVVTASTTNQKYEWLRNRASSEWAANTPVLIPLLDEWLPPSWVVKFAVDNVQVGDQISGLSLTVELWNTGPRPGSVGTWDAMPPR